MKFINYVLCSIILLSVSTSGSAQKYKAPADMVKLNKEYVKVSNEITDINAQLTIAQNDLPGYQTTANTATGNV
ncbi:hypothetical protein R1T15_25240 [Mucilaginibacter sp. L3T2-6]|uniref:hypothetical protein n=1 Tax=Mucilaginibacter sp. L3T2-6 TaxID=3062491 RepID=UPI002949BED2|nr:hypothetical protein [Mucilaginibacter sp. L3T2-6]MDV6217843.1 hypothetical protein [Mucilaginibacter sp. L3T2-6]